MQIEVLIERESGEREKREMTKRIVQKVNKSTNTVLLIEE